MQIMIRMEWGWDGRANGSYLEHVGWASPLQSSQWYKTIDAPLFKSGVVEDDHASKGH
jgi:hypothetical protein